MGTGRWMSRFVTADMPLQAQIACHRRAQNTCVYSFRMFKCWKLKGTLMINNSGTTVNGRNAAPVNMWVNGYPIIYKVCTSQVVQDIFHQQ